MWRVPRSTGVGIAEAIALKPSDVDFLRRTLRVERQRRAVIESTSCGLPAD
jgi:integrase